tara:strand:+ start:63 stop:203 length:141 start_codon:yes stop_codon:yes gene_type:complete
MEIVDGGTTYYFDATKELIVNNIFNLHIKSENIAIRGMEIPVEIEI